MKVLLNQDVASLGEIGDVVNVSDGYARNYLLPQRLAVAPSPANLKAVEERRKVIEAERIKRRQELEALAAKLNGKEITLTRMANELGHLYGSVSGRDVAEALSAEGLPVEPSEVLIHEPIRTLDKYQVDIRLAAEVQASIVLWVVPEKGTVLSPEAKAAYDGTAAAPATETPADDADADEQDEA
ncbi:MAG: 50S ribosomal protein L9 [Phycisphaerae bacterium]|nr:50S ribosomal protein L9 [Phycisphaerae bacterium]